MKKAIGTILYLGILSIMMVVLFEPNSAQASNFKISSWALYDIGGHVDYKNSESSYFSYITTGVSTWNTHRSGVLRKDTSTRIADVVISDINEVSSTNATTYSSGKIKFNIYQMSGKSESRRKNIATHELGHALGLDHNTENDVMYKYDTTKYTLSSNDKASYDYAYLCFVVAM